MMRIAILAVIAATGLGLAACKEEAVKPADSAPAPAVTEPAKQ
jgi:hypothetical protein